MILAAGRSSRFGGPKQLCDWHGGTLVEHVVKQALASRAGRVVVVTGYMGNEVRSRLLPSTSKNASLRIVHNPSFESGMASSLRTGLKALPEAMRASIFVLCDQPFVTSETIDTLIAEFRRLGTGGSDRILIPVWSGRRGNPVLFGSRWFEELKTTEGDVGGRGVLSAHADAVVEVPSGPEVVVDIDTAEDYQRISAPNVCVSEVATHARKGMHPKP